MTKRLHFPYCRLKQGPNLWENQGVQAANRYATLTSRADVGTIISESLGIVNSSRRELETNVRPGKLTKKSVIQLLGDASLAEAADQQRIPSR
ncbi:hypothetical protein P692DRAFT_20826971 [Suillus brevipes Sb2]|nr:hypothetical protein P692DRAFT_20826971 [Suillus brevipes Sb2]